MGGTRNVEGWGDSFNENRKLQHFILCFMMYIVIINKIFENLLDGSSFLFRPHLFHFFKILDLWQVEISYK